MADLLRDGLIITAVGMGLVFAALALLWGVMVLLQRLFPPGKKPFTARSRREPSAAKPVEGPAEGAAQAEPSVAPTATELAAIVTALVRWREAAAVEQSIGWRLPPLLTRWMAVGRSRQVQSWTPRR
jgi:Na+-transporting methylmalonyl-CoA/oxaloacetate decarboxylase gamma subunit